MARAENIRREIFAQHYVTMRNGTKAALAAGYAEPQARKTASRLLGIPAVANRIKELQDEAVRATRITREKILNRYMQIAFRDPRKLFTEYGTLVNTESIDDDNAAALVGIDTLEVAEIGVIRKLKFSDPKGALDSICKVLGFNAPDKVDHTTKGEKMAGSMPPIDFTQLSDTTLRELQKAILRAREPQKGKK